jgi:hypothetical protein
LAPGLFYQNYVERIKWFRYSFQPFSADMMPEIKKILDYLDAKIAIE